MQDYDTQIVVTGVLKFTSKKGQDMVKLDLLLTDPKLTGANDKFVGCTPCTQWYNGHDVFDKIVNGDVILKGVSGHFTVKQDFKDPTKTTSKLESITTKNGVITLL